MSLMNRRMLPSVIFVALSLSFAVFTAGILRVYAAPSFTVEANPTTLGPLAAGSGQTADSTITVTGHDGFVGTVSLSFPPSGLTESSTISSCSLDASVTSCSGTLTVTAASIHGPYSVDVVGSSSGYPDSTATVTVHVADFSVGANPSVVGPQNPGDTGTSTITVTAQDEFTGDVGLVLTTSSSHITASILPTSLTFTSSGPTSQTAMLSVSFDQLGTYTVLVKGQSTGYLDHSVLVTVISPATVLVVPRSQLLTSTGATVVYNVNVVSMPPFAGYDIMVVTNPNVLSPDSIDTSASALNPGTAFTNCVNNGFYANGTAIPLGSPGNINCGPGDGPGVAHSGFSSSGEFTGDGMLFSINYKPRTLDYTISASPSTVTFAAGQSGSSTINIALTSPPSTAVMLTEDAIFDSNGNPVSHNSINGNYGSVVTVVLKANPSKGLRSTVDPKFTIFTGSRTTGSATLTLTSGAAGTYSVVVSATLRYLNSDLRQVMVSHAITVNVIVT